MSEDLIQFNVENQVAIVIFNRPEKLNALNFSMFLTLDKIIKTIKKDKNIRAVVLKSIGNDFCTGLDVASVMKNPIQVLKLLFKFLPGNANLAQRVTLGWQSLPIPVIAQIQGRCWGGGMQIVLGADYRVAHTDASLSIMEARWGLCPDMGASVQLAKLMPYDQVMWLSTHAETIDAQQAKRLNLVSFVCNDVEKQTQLLLNKIFSKSPDTVSAVKRLYQTSHAINTRRALARETFNQIKLLLSKNTRRVMKANTHKQQVKFSDRSKW
ncbi:crotonase/enoyl-CoA hydratase family protein [Pseudoalteromonas denitrificans]|jgi:enoyl-CoA hydratase/carnithine racemase|uniref:Enoyl-CoA hydratase/carnithine racemase n=1 Tax=Pseudoalteromonas denitrificans DSM 6059 TaxID=1123010 RepID=A0A1I1HD95_9GAMM|nr:crotonase/enoyl-CoA hydratase family protein [Pseudoalteromonas denitrificans]SFC22129.1 Enoyl-CoA hydratase/carnithine racemase [Pseudoalteromonas denitrificans DSM 6059]